MRAGVRSAISHCVEHLVFAPDARHLDGPVVRAPGDLNRSVQHRSGTVPTSLLVFQELPSSDGHGPIDHSRTERFFSRSEWLLIVVVGALVTVLVTAGYIRSARRHHG